MILKGTGKQNKFTKFYKLIDPTLLMDAEWSKIIGLDILFKLCYCIYYSKLGSPNFLIFRCFIILG